MVTFVSAFAEIAKLGGPLAIRTAVLHHKQVSRRSPDFLAQRIIKWRWTTYPWAVVKDLTEILSQEKPAAWHPVQLERYLADEIRIRLPRAVPDQIISIVLQRLKERDRSNGT